jgi:uncharacterized protein YyaL (SSP411 family)
LGTDRAKIFDYIYGVEANGNAAQSDTSGEFAGKNVLIERHSLEEAAKEYNVHPIDQKATAYVCENFVCQLPTSDPAVLARLLDNRKSPPTDNRAKQDAEKQ